MNFTQFLNETPYLMYAERDDIDEMADSYDTVMKNKVATEGKYDDKYEIIHYKKHYYAIVDHDRKRVLVNSKLSEIKRGSKKFFSQVLLWKYPGVKSPAVEFLFMHLLDKYKMILSDDAQTEGSATFWRRLVKKLIGTADYNTGYVDEHGDVIKFNAARWEKTFLSLYEPENEYTHIFIKKIN